MTLVSRSVLLSTTEMGPSLTQRAHSFLKPRLLTGHNVLTFIVLTKKPRACDFWTKHHEQVVVWISDKSCCFSPSSGIECGRASCIAYVSSHHVKITTINSCQVGQTQCQCAAVCFRPDNLCGSASHPSHCRALLELQLRSQNKATPKQLRVPGLWLHSLK